MRTRTAGHSILAPVCVIITVTCVDKWDVSKSQLVKAEREQQTRAGSIKLGLMEYKSGGGSVFSDAAKKSSGSALNLLFCSPDLCVVDLLRKKKHQ
jgi:hypothetical protein